MPISNIYYSNNYDSFKHRTFMFMAKSWFEIKHNDIAEALEDNGVFIADSFRVSFGSFNDITISFPHQELSYRLRIINDEGECSIREINGRDFGHLHPLIEDNMIDRPLKDLKEAVKLVVYSLSASRYILFDMRWRWFITTILKMLEDRGIEAPDVTDQVSSVKSHFVAGGFEVRIHANDMMRAINLSIGSLNDDSTYHHESVVKYDDFCKMDREMMLNLAYTTMCHIVMELHRENCSRYRHRFRPLDNDVKLNIICEMIQDQGFLSFRNGRFIEFRLDDMYIIVSEKRRTTYNYVCVACYAPGPFKEYMFQGRSVPYMTRRIKKIIKDLTRVG